jgi:hypothetical protein
MHYLAWFIFIVLCISETLSQVKLVRAKIYYTGDCLKQHKLTMIVWLLDSIYLAYYYFGM